MKTIKRLLLLPTLTALVAVAFSVRLKQTRPQLHLRKLILTAIRLALRERTSTPART